MCFFLQIISFVITSIALILSQRLGARRLNLAASLKRAASENLRIEDESNPLLAASGSEPRVDSDELESLVAIEDLMFSSNSNRVSGGSCSTQCCATNTNSRGRQRKHLYFWRCWKYFYAYSIFLLQERFFSYFHQTWHLRTVQQVILLNCISIIEKSNNQIM
jgi:hypothetical protein